MYNSISKTIDIYNGTTKVAQLSNNECSCIITRNLNGVRNLELEYVSPKLMSKAEFLETDYIIKIYNTKDETTEDFKIITITDERKGNGVLYKIHAEFLMQVVTNNEILDTNLNLTNYTVEDALTKVLEYSTYSASTTSADYPTTTINLELDYTTVLFAIQEICKLSNGFYTLNGSTISIKSSSGSNNYVRIETGLNAKSFSRQTNYSEIKNKIFGTGNGKPLMNLTDTPHKAISFTDLGGGELKIQLNENSIPEDDIYNGFKIRWITGNKHSSSSTYPITDSSESDDWLQVTSPLSGMTGGEYFIILDSSGNSINYVHTGSGDKEAILQNSGKSLITNYARNTKLTEYDAVSHLADEFEKVNLPALSENTDTDYIEQGDRSQKVVCTSGGTKYQGIKQYIITSDSNTYWSISIRVYITSGVFYFGLTEDIDTGYVIKSTSTGWKTLKIENILDADGLFYIYAFGEYNATSADNSVFYIDHIQVEKSKEAHRFTSFSEVNDLWRECVVYAKKYKTGRIIYNINFYDLYRYDSGKYSHLKVDLGDTVTVYDEKLSIQTELKVVGQTEDIFNPIKIENILSNDT